MKTAARAKKRSAQASVTKEQLERILSHGLTAPSGDNCQPWRFEWSGKALSVFHVEDRGRHAMNRGNHASALALGCLVEMIAIAASAEELEAHTEFLGFDDGGKATAKITFSESTAGVDPLFEAIPMRRADRRMYRLGRIPAAAVSEALAETERFPRCRVRFELDMSFAWHRYLAKTESIFWRLANVHRDLLQWIRWNEKSEHNMRGGMPWKSLGISWPEAQVLRLSGLPGLRKILLALGLSWGFQLFIHSRLFFSSGFWCLTLNERSMPALVEAGRAALRVWMRLALRGCASQPYSYGSLSIYDREDDLLAPEEARFDALLEQGSELFKENFTLRGGETPVWLFRTGLAPRSPCPGRPRPAPLQSVLIVLKNK